MSIVFFVTVAISHITLTSCKNSTNLSIMSKKANKSARKRLKKLNGGELVHKSG